MTAQRLHWLEKLQVQLATVITVSVGYFILWPILRNSDPQAPMSMLISGGVRRVGLFAIGFWVLAGLCGASTVSARPHGALVALLIGTGGLSLRSPSIRSLLWTHLEATGWLYRTLILEVLALGAGVIIADIIAALVRRGIAGVKPQWMWKPLPPESSPEKAEKTPEVTIDLPRCPSVLLDTVLVGALIRVFAALIGRSKKKSVPLDSERKLLARTVAFLTLTFVIAAVLVLSLMRSGDRGQILFALLGSFFLATWIAHQFFPSPLATAGLILPFILAVCLYALGAVSVVGQPPQGWIEISIYARALPIDWLTAGCGGSILGYWVSSRTHDARRIQRLEEEKQT